MNIAKSWLRQAIQTLYKEDGIEPCKHVQEDHAHLPVSMGEYSNKLWDKLREQSQKAGDENWGQYNEP